MRVARTPLAIALLLATGLTGCSSISLPSLPSMPWSSSAANPDPTAEAIFDEGVRFFNEKRYARAIDAFSRVKSDHPFSPQLTEAELKLADSYFLNQQYPEAIAAFKEFQALHPTNPNIPFVLYRLGEAHLAQFSAVDRDQKNTHIAKTYFENLLTNHPNSPYTADAKARLLKTLEYLAEHDFNIAFFYYNQEKYPAARDRFEEIVRRYDGTATAVKSLFYLGESYRRENNNIKAALAYEALLYHHPESRFAAEAKNQLARLSNERHDPLAMLLMRDRRPSAAPAPQPTQDSALARLKEMEFIAKTDVVHEEPGGERGFFRRVIDRINPFSSSGDSQDETKAYAARNEVPARNNAGGKDGRRANDSPLIEKIDDSLKDQGIAANEQVATIKPPTAALPAPEAPAPVGRNTDELLRDIDSRLEKSGKEIAEITPPEPAEGLRKPAPAIASAPTKPQVQESTATRSLLSSIDERLRQKGVEPPQYEMPPLPVETKEKATPKEQPQKVELEPKLAADQKGPLFLNPTEVESTPAVAGSSPSEAAQDPGFRQIPSKIVKAPKQPETTSGTPKTVEQKKAADAQLLDEENKGVFDQLREDIERVNRLLNPFKW